MPHDVQVRWTKATGNGPPVERWFAGVDRPTHTSSFAHVERIDGQWWLVLFPKWSIRHLPDIREQRIAYRSARTAKKHLEAWVCANWPTIERRFGIYKPPPDRGPEGQ